MPRERGRERVIARIRSVLERAGFYVSDAHHVRPTAFDLIARRDSLLLILKVLKNVDALDGSEAKRLHDLSRLFGAQVLLVGQSSGTTPLEPGVVYGRYGIPILVEESLEEYLVKGVPPFLVSSPGGIFARIDGARLRALREAGGLSLGALAGVAGVSRRTIQLYEEDGGAEVTVVERLERYLGETIARPIDPFEGTGFGRRPEAARSANAEEETEEDAAPRRARTLRATGDELRDSALAQLGGMGWEVFVTVRCPFDAFSTGDLRGGREVLITTVGSLRSARHRADLLQQIAHVAEGHALFIVREASGRRSIEGLPLFTVPELRRHRDPAELIDEIAERESA